MSTTEEEEEVICKYILRIKKKIVQPDLEEERIVKYLHNLNKLPVSVKSLKTTGIGIAINELKRKDGIVGKKALELVTRWKNKFNPKKHDNSTIDKNKPIKEVVDFSYSEENDRKKDKNEKPSSSTYQKPPDHWKDISLNLLGTPSKKVKKKRKANNEDVSQSPLKREKQLPETDKKKHVIPVRRDPAMPSLPDIQLPEIQRVYRPLHFSNSDTDNESRKKRKATTEVDLGVDIVSRKSRTQVFSGRRTIAEGVVPSLYQQCMRILIENMDALEDTGGVPFEILEPLLSKASPAQLVRLEEFNPYFTEDTGEIWKFHCQKEFKGYEPQDMESYREMYFRLYKERAEKLKNIQSKITESQAKKDPARQAKLAYIAGPPKPSAQIRRKQIRHGTGEDAERVAERQKQIRSQIENRHREEAVHTIPFNKVPKRERIATEAAQARPRLDFHVKKAASKPMMKAAMKMMKQQRNRGTVQIMRK